MPIAAAIQMNSSAHVAENLSAAHALLEQAARRGAKLAALPENFAIMGETERDKLGVAEPDGAGPIQSWLAETARELKLWVVGGTIPLRATPVAGGADKVSAACLVFDADGRRAARYDKMHLFDVDIPGRDESYRESATIAAGNAPVVVDTPVGRLGLAVCYDMRFPELCRHLAREGAQVLSFPAAFTVPTGQAHWDVLLRSRAIENLSYVLAPAQVGTHASGRATYGNTLIVDPWGTVLDRATGGPGLVLAEIDLPAQADVRERFPALKHRKM
jgi:deaminated glutathione amidase